MYAVFFGVTDHNGPYEASGGTSKGHRVDWGLRKRRVRWRGPELAGQYALDLDGKRAGDGPGLAWEGPESNIGVGSKG